MSKKEFREIAEALGLTEKELPDEKLEEYYKDVERNTMKFRRDHPEAWRQAEKDREVNRIANRDV